MQIISYVKISNFKGFGQNIIIDFSQPSVLIGPNNSGKTSILQALAMWSLGLKTWYQDKGRGKSKSKTGTSINRLNITQVPIKEAKYFWQNASVRTDQVNIELIIAVGVFFEGKVVECSAIFKYFNAESIYCFPDENARNMDGLLTYISTLDVKILYPMSGIAREEALIAEGRIDVLIGQGQTSEVLRNLCYKVLENDQKNGSNDWKAVASLMQKLFSITLQEPYFNTNLGTVELSYLTPTISSKKNSLDIGLSGRGQQEMLLLISYLYTHKKAIILLDEPDAHLEILRQKQVFSVLKNLAESNDNQLIIATHSEVILNEASDDNLTLILDGNAINLSAEISKKAIKSALKDYGLEHYYKAKICKNVLYLEGNTDIEMLRAFAKKLQHPAQQLLDDKVYSYYITDIAPSQSLEKDLDKASGYYQTAKAHFQAIASCVPDFRGIGIFDNDNKSRQDEVSPSLALLYWKKYEIENYFAFPYIIEAYLKTYFQKQRRWSPIEVENTLTIVRKEISQAVLTELIDNDQNAFNEYQHLAESLQKSVFKSYIQNKKASQFLEKCFYNIGQALQSKIILNKGQYYLLIQYIDIKDIDPEIVQKLDELVKYLMPRP